MGYRYLETDVQLTRDGVLVAFHDANLSRTCDVDQDISELTVAELSRQRISGLEPVPLLSDLLEELPEALFNIDAKSDASVQPLIDFLRRTDVLHRVCIGSFSHRRLRTIRRALGDQVCTSASPLEVAAWMVGKDAPGPSCVQIPLKQFGLGVASERRIERSSRKGLPVHVWTIDDPNDMQRVIDLGVHGIMTDQGNILKDVAARNLMWYN